MTSSCQVADCNHSPHSSLSKHVRETMVACRLIYAFIYAPTNTNQNQKNDFGNLHLCKHSEKRGNKSNLMWLRSSEIMKKALNGTHTHQLCGCVVRGNFGTTLQQFNVWAAQTFLINKVKAPSIVNKRGQSTSTFLSPPWFIAVHVHSLKAVDGVWVSSCSFVTSSIYTLDL